MWRMAVRFASGLSSNSSRANHLAKERAGLNPMDNIAVATMRCRVRVRRESRFRGEGQVETAVRGKTDMTVIVAEGRKR